MCVEKARVFSVQPRARLGLIQLRAHPRSQLQYPIAQMRTPRLRENQSFGSLCPPSGLWLGSSGGGGPRGGQARLVPLFSIPRRRPGALGCAVHPSSFLPASPKDLVMRSVPCETMSASGTSSGRLVHRKFVFLESQAEVDWENGDPRGAGRTGFGGTSPRMMCAFRQAS